MPRYGCPECGSNEAEVRSTEHHWTWGHWDNYGNYSQQDSEFEDGDYENSYCCGDCGHHFNNPVETCLHCERPEDSCECTECEECGEKDHSCTCKPIERVRRRRQHVNPMAKFASDMART